MPGRNTPFPNPPPPWFPSPIPRCPTPLLLPCLNVCPTISGPDQKNPWPSAFFFPAQDKLTTGTIGKFPLFTVSWAERVTILFTISRLSIDSIKHWTFGSITIPPPSMNLKAFTPPPNYTPYEQAIDAQETTPSWASWAPGCSKH